MDPITIAVVTSVLGALASYVVEFFRHGPKTRKSGETIEDRVGKLTKALTDATALIGSIEAEINARSALATQLQADVDKYTKLVEVKKPEVEAIAQLLRGELKKEGRSSFWKGFATNFLFFILGVGASWVINLITMQK